MARTISAGGVISLRIQFKDDLGVPSEAQNVKVFIFEPGVDTSDNSLAVVPAGVCTVVVVDVARGPVRGGEP